MFGEFPGTKYLLGNYQLSTTMTLPSASPWAGACLEMQSNRINLKQPNIRVEKDSFQVSAVLYTWFVAYMRPASRLSLQQVIIRSKYACVSQ